LAASINCSAPVGAGVAPFVPTFAGEGSIIACIANVGVVALLGCAESAMAGVFFKIVSGYEADVLAANVEATPP
jgi:hypothetical protein